MRRMTGSLALVPVVALALAGCGSSSTTSAKPTNAASASSVWP